MATRRRQHRWLRGGELRSQLQQDWLRHREDGGAAHAIVVKYARLRKGKPVRCKGSAADRADPRAHSIGKVIYDSEKIAAACAAELLAVLGKRQRPYPCDRSRHGHAHLTSRW